MSEKESAPGNELKAAIRELYSKVAEGSASCCGDGSPEMRTGTASVETIGYRKDLLEGIPAEVIDANAGVGNPVDLAGLSPGEAVLDLGSGAGLDCFLAAKAVGNKGRVIGLDMTDAMLEKAEANRKRLGLDNVEFRKGEMEAMPLEDESVDAVISNCVVNLSPDKPAVFREAFRVLRPGGRLVVSDVIRAGARRSECSTEDWCACIAGAISEEEYLDGLRGAGFEAARVFSRKPYLAEGLESAAIQALKPKKSG